MDVHDCSRHVQSPVRTVFESLICVALVASYIPQYIRIVTSGTFGISPWFILSTTLFSTTQLATQFSNAEVKYAFDCVNSGQLRGFKAYSALLGFIQPIVQWVCAVIFVIIFIQYRDDAPPPSSPDQLPPATGITTHPLSSSKLRITIATYVIALIPISLVFLWRPDLVEENFELDIWLTIGAYLFEFFWTLANILIMLLQHLPQILTTLSLRTRGSISIVSLVLQIVVFIVLGISQFLRWGIPKYGSPPQRAGPFDIYLRCLHISLNWILTALGQLVLLVICIVVDRDRHLYGEIALGEQGIVPK